MAINRPWGRDPRSPVDFPAESEEEMRRRAATSVDLLRNEQAVETNPALEREIARNSALAGNLVQDAVQKVSKMPWDDDPTVAEPTSLGMPWEADEIVPEEVGLLSKKGAKAVAETAKASLPITVLQQQYQAHEAVVSAWEKDPAKAAKWQGTTKQSYEESKQRLAEVKAALAEAESDIAVPGETNSLRWAKSAVQSVVTNLPGLLASVLGRGAGATAALPALHGAKETATSSGYVESRKEGASIEESTVAGEVKGASEVGFELMPLKFLVEQVGKAPVGELVKGLLAREIPTELATTIANNMTDWAVVNPDLTIQDFTAKLAGDLVDTAVVTGISTPLTGGIAHGIARAGRRTPEPTSQTKLIEPEDLYDPIAQASLATDVGAVFGENSAPTADWPTVRHSAGSLQAIEQSIAQINPEDITKEQLDEARKVLAEAKAENQNPKLPAAGLAWGQIATAPTSPVEDAGELGASARSTANAANYVNPNQGERLDRKFSYGPDGYVGMTPNQVMPKPGTYVLGEVSEDRPADYLEAAWLTVSQWQKQYLPKATIVLSNEQLPSNSALGWHYTSDKNQHIIVPAVLRKPAKGWGQYNPNTKATAFYNLTHEFGHALISDRFYSGVPDNTVALIRDASRQGTISDELMAQAPVEQVAVMQEFNAVKDRILSGSMTAEEFVSEWMGPAKIGRANFLKDLRVAPKAPAKQLVNAIVARAAEESTIVKADAKAALQQRMTEDFLSLDEYLAEQTTRFAYQKKWDQSSPLGKFFSETLRVMRQFFIDRKKDGTITAGVAFQDWMEGLGKTPRPLEEKVKLANRKAAMKKEPSTAKVPVKSAAKRGKPKVKVERLQHNVESDTSQARAKKARGMVVNLVRSGIIERGDSMYGELMGYINRDELQEFLEIYTKLTGKTVNFEYDGGWQDVSKDPEWERQHFQSPAFKAWFGDWERDPVGSSKIRIAAFKQDRGIISLDTEKVTPPMVLFTTAERLKTGVNAFHASNVRGQHYAESLSETSPGDLTMVPVVLNVRNPFIQGDFSAPAPARAELQAQGYDGIVYQNDLDGNLSFIVFNPNQIRVVPDRAPYGPKGQYHLELDHDQSTTQGQGIAKVLRGVRSFMAQPALMNRAVKHTTSASRVAFQLQQLAQVNPQHGDLEFFVRMIQEYNTFKASQMSNPDKNLDFWEDVTNPEFERIKKFLLEQSKSDERWFDLIPSRKQRQGQMVDWWEVRVSSKTLQEAKRLGIDVEDARGKEILRHLTNVEQSLIDLLNEDEYVLMNLLAHRHQNTRHLNAAALILKQKVHELRAQPFFPRKWFGRYQVVVTKASTTGPGYEVIHRMGFDSQIERDRAFAKLEKSKQADENVQKKELTDTQYVLMGLPADFLKTVSEELDLRDEQVDKLTEILQPVKQEKLFRARQQALEGVTGYSEDVMRSYADYTWHHANALAKTYYRKQFNLAIDKTRRERDRLSYTNDPGYYKENNILRAMEGTRDYMMSPPNEWYAARAMVSMLYLAGNIKTALANSFGLMLSWSDLTSRHGAVEGEKRFYQAAYWSTASVWGKEKLPKQIQEGLNRALEEGVLSQSYAYHLAGQANSSRMWRVLSRRKAIRYSQKALDGTMFPFRLMELATRRITFLASLQEELERPNAGFNEAYLAAVTRTNALQNDYSLGNRAPFMRGTLSPLVPLFTIFMSFAQHAAFHSLGGYELGRRRQIRERVARKELPPSALPKSYELLYGHTARLWALLFFLAGYEGLPFAENFLDVVEWIWKRYGKKPIRQELREYVQSIEEDPHLWARGLTHNVAGFDLSRSVGFGRLFPGTDVLAKSQQFNVENSVGTAILDLAGVTGATLKWAFEMSPVSDKPVEDAMKGAPGAIGNLWNSYYWSKYGVLGPNEAAITIDPETKQLRDLNAKEIVGKSMGFNPTVVSENREVKFAQWDREVYWLSYQRKLKERVWRGVWQKDADLERDARDAIKEFNETLGNDPEWRALRISDGELAKYVQRKKQAKRKEEQQLPRNKRFRGLYQDVRRSYDRPDSDEEESNP